MFASLVSNVTWCRLHAEQRRHDSLRRL